MDFGTLIVSTPERVAADTQYAETRGFAHAWFPDSHMIYGDVYVNMALAAAATQRIRLGTGVAVATNRIAPVHAHSIASINAIAPGRVDFGFGTGHTARRVMGLPPVRQAEFREQLRVLSELLRDGEATFNTEGLSRQIRFLHRERKFIELTPQIPLYVAANGAKALALAGAYGDGVITGRITSPARVATVKAQIEEGAQAVGRILPARLPIVSLTHVCVLKPGEAADSPRVVDLVGHWVAAALHGIAAGYSNALNVPPDARPIFEAYAEFINQQNIPTGERYLHLHRGHVIYLLPEERRFITPETIRATTLVGTREQLIEQIHALEESGITQLIINPPIDRYRECIDEIANELIARA